MLQNNDKHCDQINVFVLADVVEWQAVYNAGVNNQFLKEIVYLNTINFWT